MAGNPAPEVGTGFADHTGRPARGVEAIKHDLAKLAADTADAGAAGRQGSHAAPAPSKDGLAEAANAAKEAGEALGRLVKLHPLAGIGLAAGAGLLLGLVLGRPGSAR